MTAAPVAAPQPEVEALRIALVSGLIPDRSVAIDGGAHVGSWSEALAEHFGKVIAFEPEPESFRALCANMGELRNVECRNEALLEEAGRVDVLAPRPKRQQLTSRIVERSKSGAIRCIAIDDLNLVQCGLIKLDLEGSEPLALEGARRTIMRCRPALIVEICGHARRFGYLDADVERMIVGMKYVRRMRVGVNSVFVPR